MNQKPIEIELHFVIGDGVTYEEYTLIQHLPSKGDTIVFRGGDILQSVNQKHDRPGYMAGWSIREDVLAQSWEVVRVTHTYIGMFEDGDISMFEDGDTHIILELQPEHPTP